MSRMGLSTARLFEPRYRARMGRLHRRAQRRILRSVSREGGRIAFADEISAVKCSKVIARVGRWAEGPPVGAGLLARTAGDLRKARCLPARPDVTMRGGSAPNKP